MPGSGLKLPLDLHAIGARCSNAYFAPKRFAAVQLAFSNPRCRVLVFRERPLKLKPQRSVAPRLHVAVCLSQTPGGSLAPVRDYFPLNGVPHPV